MRYGDRKIVLTAAAVGLLALCGVFILGRQSASSDLLDEEVDTAPAKRTAQPYYRQPVQQEPELFVFDPNTADSSQLLRLGLRPWQVRNIYKYRAHGGVYRRKEDFASLYGLTVADYRRLAPYIHIGNDYQPAASLFRNMPRDSSRRTLRDTVLRPVKIREGEHIVLNTADTTQLRRVPGIGVYFANEIVSHGRWLGGYVSVDQLDEIDNFPTSAKKYFIVERPQPKRLNLNRLSLNQLRRHPYINFYQAKAIVDYRRLQGALTSLQELRLCGEFTADDLQRLEPYVEF